MKTGIAVVVSLLVAPCALAGVPNTLLYAQNPVPTAGYVSSVFPEPDFPSQRIAETIARPFGLILPARVYRIDWWGGVNSGPGFDLSNIESFNITVATKFNGQILMNETISIDDLDVTLEFDNLGSPDPAIHRFSYRINQNPPLFGSDAAILSIAANYVDDVVGQQRFLWALSDQGDDDLFVNIEGSGYAPLNSGTPNVAYALYGFAPSPGAFALLGLAGITAARRRR